MLVTIMILNIIMLIVLLEITGITKKTATITTTKWHKNLVHFVKENRLMIDYDRSILIHKIKSNKK